MVYSVYYITRSFLISLTMHKSIRLWHDLPSEVENDTLYRQGHSGGAMATDTFTMSVPFSAPVDPPKNIVSLIFTILRKYKPKDLSEFRQAVTDDTWTLICVKLQ